MGESKEPFVGNVRASEGSHMKTRSILYINAVLSNNVSTDHWLRSRKYHVRGEIVFICSSDMVPLKRAAIHPDVEGNPWWPGHRTRPKFAFGRTELRSKVEPTWKESGDTYLSSL